MSSTKPVVLICGYLVWAQNDAEKMFKDIATIVMMDSPTREDFYLNCQSPSGKYSDVIGIYRHNSSAERIGVFDKDLIQHLPPTVKWLAHNGAGYDQIDVEACLSKGIIISNTPGAVDHATATTALYLLISTCRQFSKAERSARALTWKSPLKPAHDPSALKLGILGLGGIGQHFAEMAHAAFGMETCYYSRNKKESAPEWCVYIGDLETFLGSVDVVSVHIALKEGSVDQGGTVGFMGEKELGWMKKGGILINTARGKVIDEEAMIRALENGQLSTVGLDVYPSEPKINPRLLEFENITLLPHMGTETRESQHKMELRALGNLLDYFEHGQGKDIVPEMTGLGVKR